MIYRLIGFVYYTVTGLMMLSIGIGLIAFAVLLVLS
jgi:hypothetical protein